MLKVGIAKHYIGEFGKRGEERSFTLLLYNTQLVRAINLERIVCFSWPPSSLLKKSYGKMHGKMHAEMQDYNGDCYLCYDADF